MTSLDKEYSLKQEVLLQRIANRIRQSLDLKEILNAMVAEVRTYLGTDRIKVYQFKSDGSGVVVAESVAENRLPSLMGLHFPADDIPLYARELFVRARQRNVVDLATHEIGISFLNSPETGKENENQDIRYRPVDPCHVEYLTAMGVKSSIVVPIVLEGQQAEQFQPPSLPEKAQLWGLLVSHHSVPCKVSEDELQFIQAIVDQVCVAITHSILLNQVREQASQEANINSVTKLLYSTSTVRLQPALEEAVATFGGYGGRLYLMAQEEESVEIYTCGSQPEFLENGQGRVIEENLVWQKYLYSGLQKFPDQTGYKPWSVQWMRSVYDLAEKKNEEAVSSDLWVINDLYREPLFRTLAPFFQSSKIRSVLIIPLVYATELVGCLTIFRDEVDTEILWAGYHNPDTRQLMPRQSFDMWREVKSNQARVWTVAEIKYAHVLGERFSTAIKQYRLYQRVQALNTNLEQQVQERTNNLKQTQIQLIQSEKMSSLGQLVTGIAHEINNPVNFIYGNISHIYNHTQAVLSLLSSYQQHCPEATEKLQPEIQQADIDFITKDLPNLCESLKTGAERIRKIVTSLRTFSCVDQSEIKSVDIHEGLESVLLLLQHRLQKDSSEDKIEIIKNYGKLPLVECFSSLLNQVFLNLLANSIDELQLCYHYGEKKAKRTIEIRTMYLNQRWVQVAIKDNGRGIPQNIQKKLFDPFFTTKRKGTGLGLSISYQVIERHGGKLYCYSKAGSGAEFIIEIPLKLNS